MKLCMGCMGEIRDNDSICPYCGYDNSSMARHEAYSLEPGTVLNGKYIAGRVLGYNGYAVKYIGLDASNSRKVIISEYLPEYLSERTNGIKDVTIYSGSAAEQFGEGLIAFLNESSLLCRIKSTAGLCSVYDCFAGNETGYVISEYPEGKSLEQLLNEGVKFTVNSTKKVARILLQCLIAVHKQGIIHGGISPGNIFIMKDGSAKLTDFGIAGHGKLKPGYAAEEQYNGGACGSWTDVYAVGAVMYRMVTDTGLPEASERALRDNCRPPSSMVKGIPKPVENAMLNAINVFKKDRTLNAQAFLAELESNSTERRSGKKKKEGSVPLWVKIAAAVFACAAIAAGVMLFNAQRNEADLKISGKADEKFSTYINKPYGEFIKKWCGYKWPGENEYADDMLKGMLEVEYRYDTSVEKDTIKEFIDQTESGCMVDGQSMKNIYMDKKVRAALESISKNKKARKKNIVARIIVASNTRYTFLEEWFDDVAKAKPEAGKDGNITVTYDQKKCGGTIIEGNNTDEPFGKIEKVVAGKEVVFDGKGKKRLTGTTYDKNKNNLKITYYVGSYYMMAKNREHNEGYYLGKNIRDISDFIKVEPKENNKKYTSQTLDISKYDQNYISFDPDKKEHTIIKVNSQRLKKGERYDERKESVKPFDTVGKFFEYGKITVGQLEEYCKNNNVKCIASGFKPGYLVKKVTGEVNGKEVDKEIFMKEDIIKVKYAEPKPTPTPVPTPVPTKEPEVKVTRRPEVTAKPAPEATKKPEKPTDINPPKNQDSSGGIDISKIKPED